MKDLQKFNHGEEGSGSTHSVCNKHNIGMDSICCECTGKEDCSDSLPMTKHQKKITEEKHGWDKSCSIFNCSDGVHTSWWVAISRTPEWKRWYKHASGNHLYDVDEVQECGWMSEEHAKDFMRFIAGSQSSELKREIEKMRKEQLDKNDPDNYGACYAIGGFNDALDKILKILK